MHIQGAMLVPMLGFFALAALTWRYKKLPRIHAWFAGATAFCGWFAFPDLMDALIVKAATSTAWLTGLLIAALVSAFAMLFEGILAHRFHPVGTPFLLTVSGICAATVYAGEPQIVYGGKQLLPQAGKAISQSITQARTQQFTQAPTPGVSHQQTVWLIIAAVVIVLLFLVLGRINANRRAPAPQPILRPGATSRMRRKITKAAGGAPAIGGGPGNTPVPTGRRK